MDSGPAVARQCSGANSGLQTTCSQPIAGATNSPSILVLDATKTATKGALCAPDNHIFASVPKVGGGAPERNICIWPPGDQDFVEVSLTEVLKAVKVMPVASAPGLDQILVVVLHKNLFIFVPWLRLIYSASLSL